MTNYTPLEAAAKLETQGISDIQAQMKKLTSGGFGVCLYCGQYVPNKDDLTALRDLVELQHGALKDLHENHRLQMDHGFAPPSKEGLAKLSAIRALAAYEAQRKGAE